MAQLIQNSFSSYELTIEEELQGSILTITQLQVLQNQLAFIVEEKINIEFDPAPDKVLEFVQQEAYKKGQMELLQYIISNSEVATKEYMNSNLDNQNED